MMNWTCQGHPHWAIQLFRNARLLEQVLSCLVSLSTRTAREWNEPEAFVHLCVGSVVTCSMAEYYYLLLPGQLVVVV
jgi:hypothetical protein